jgi:hypothetical protein
MSMPEASDLLDSSNFSMRVREMDGLGPLHEQEEYSRGEPQEFLKTVEAGKNRINTDICISSDAEIDESKDNVEGDFGFFAMDGDDDSEDCHNDLQEDAVSASNSDTSSDQTGSSFDESSTGRRTRKKSALKRGSAYGDGNEGIPLDFERKEFNRVLPKPDFVQRVSVPSRRPRSGSRGLFRVSSEPVFVRPVYQNDDDDDDADEEHPPVNSVPSSGFVEGAMKKRISFGTIQIREHAQTIGDNPSCSYGTPVQLDWDHQDLEDVEVDEYETFRVNKTRTKQEFYLNHFQRMNLLKLNGFSVNEINDSKRRVTKIRRQRENTKFKALNHPQLFAVEDAIESGLRKVKRSMSKSKLNSKDGVENMPRKSSKDDLAVSMQTKSLILDIMDNDESNATAPF